MRYDKYNNNYEKDGDYMNTAETLREAIKTAGLTQQKLANQYKIPQRTLEAWLAGDRKPPEYVVDLLLRCLATDFPMEQDDLTEQKEPTYIFYDRFGKPLPPKLSELIRSEYLAGKYQEQDGYTQDFYGESVSENGEDKLYLCTGSNDEIPMGLEWRVKEV